MMCRPAGHQQPQALRLRPAIDRQRPDVTIENGRIRLQHLGRDLPGDEGIKIGGVKRRQARQRAHGHVAALVIGAGVEILGGGADDLILSVHLDHERRAVSFFLIGRFVDDARAWRFPRQLARGLVERGDVLDVCAVAREDEQLLEQRRRTARTVLMIELQLLIAPENFRVARRQARRAERAEVNVHTPVLEDRAGRGVAVEGVLEARRGHVKNHDVMHEPAGLAIHADGAQRSARLGGRRHPDLLAEDHRRRPAGARDRRRPADVIGFTPDQRQAGGVGMSLAIRSAKLRPGVRVERGGRARAVEKNRQEKSAVAPREGCHAGPFLAEENDQSNPSGVKDVARRRGRGRLDQREKPCRQRTCRIDVAPKLAIAFWSITDNG